jgi:hypothetical protein
VHQYQQWSTRIDFHYQSFNNLGYRYSERFSGVQGSAVILIGISVRFKIDLVRPQETDGLGYRVIFFNHSISPKTSNPTAAGWSRKNKVKTESRFLKCKKFDRNTPRREAVP